MRLPDKTAIVACDVFEEELRALLPSLDNTELRFLEMGLHDAPDHLRHQLEAVIAELEHSLPVETIILAYGRCGNGLVGIKAGRCQLVLPQAHDCLSILLGGRARHDALLKETPGTYFYSPGWIRGRRVPGPDRENHLRDHYAERYGDDEDMLEDLVEADRDAFAHHTCAAYVDITGNAEAEAYCRNCAAHMQWTFKRLEGDASFLRDLLTGAWEDPNRFLKILPGQSIGVSAEGHLIAEDPR